MRQERYGTWFGSAGQPPGSEASQFATVQVAGGPWLRPFLE
jgi:hypothetical protein